jgi:hypothetical protein
MKKVEDWRNKYYVARDSTNRSRAYINRLDAAKQQAGGLFEYLRGGAPLPSGNVPADKDGDTDSTDAPLDLQV